MVPIGRFNHGDRCITCRGSTERAGELAQEIEILCHNLLEVDAFTDASPRTTNREEFHGGRLH